MSLKRCFVATRLEHEYESERDRHVFCKLELFFYPKTGETLDDRGRTLRPGELTGLRNRCLKKNPRMRDCVAAKSRRKSAGRSISFDKKIKIYDARKEAY
jgi:hypothetical protein